MKRRVIAAVMAALIIGALASPAQAAPMPPSPSTRTCFHGTALVSIPEAFVAGQYASWEIHYRWCSTSILWGATTAYSQYHTLSGLGGASLTKDDGIIEDSGTYYTWAGRWHGGHYAHVKGRITTCFFGWCLSTTPWANIWVHMDGSTHVTTGGV